MELYVVWCLSALTLFVGSGQCSCTDDKIINCAYDNLDSPCFTNEPIINCINKFYDSCEGIMKVKALEMLKYHRKLNQERLSTCPAVPDGECWRDGVSNCTNRLPQFIYSITLGFELFQRKLDTNECKKLIGMETGVRSCLEGFVQHCNNTKPAKHERDDYYLFLNKGVKACNKHLQN